MRYDSYAGHVHPTSKRIHDNLKTSYCPGQVAENHVIDLQIAKSDSNYIKKITS